ncbi:MAG: flagellar basal body-associated FliL family protein [Desulfobacteraceae bacterium]|jgi:flagellar FliL protein
MSKSVLIIIIAAFVLIMGMMGGGFFLMWKQMSAAVAQVNQNDTEEADAEAVEEEQEVTIGPMYKMDTMIVNLADRGGKRYLRVTMQFELSTPEVVEEIDMRLPQIRDTILMILPAKQYADISTTQGKVTLREELMAQLNGYLKKGAINTIYFTEFVVQ